MIMDLKGKKVLVIGLARSGMAAIKGLDRLGAKITLSESKSRNEIKEAEDLEAIGVEITNQDMSVFERDFDLVVKNPGVPFRTPMIERLNERKIKIITEIELAYNVAKPQHYVAITGTNGKTTTTSLVYEILNRAFPGNNDAWWVNNETRAPHEVTLHRGYAGDGIAPRDVAKTIFRTEKSVHTVKDNYSLATYRRQ